MHFRDALRSPFLPLALAALAATACGPGAPGAVVPAEAPTVSREQASRWVAPTVPAGHVLHRFRWLFRDERSSAGGSGSARYAGPDSLRFDVRGPLGAGAAAAVVVGDTAVWTRPPEAIERLVPNYPLMWAMFGVARLPTSTGTTIRGLQDGDRTSWHYVEAGDTIAYVRTAGAKPTLVTIVRRGGEVLGRAETEFSAEGRPVKAKLVVPEVPAQLELTFTASGPARAFPADVWSPPAAE
jgi:hypothetical protein